MGAADFGLLTQSTAFFRPRAPSGCSRGHEQGAVHGGDLFAERGGGGREDLALFLVVVVVERQRLDRDHPEAEADLPVGRGRWDRTGSARGDQLRSRENLPRNGSARSVTAPMAAAHTSPVVVRLTTCVMSPAATIGTEIAR